MTAIHSVLDQWADGLQFTAREFNFGRQLAAVAHELRAGGPDGMLAVGNWLDPHEGFATLGDGHRLMAARHPFADLRELRLGFNDPEGIHHAAAYQRSSASSNYGKRGE